MDKEAIRRELTRDPFVPVRLHLTDGRTLDVASRRGAVMVYQGVVVFIGLKPGTRCADRHQPLGYQQIEKITPIPSGPPRDCS